MWLAATGAKIKKGVKIRYAFPRVCSSVLYCSIKILLVCRVGSHSPTPIVYFGHVRNNPMATTGIKDISSSIERTHRDSLVDYYHYPRQGVLCLGYLGVIVIPTYRPLPCTHNTCCACLQILELLSLAAQGTGERQFDAWLFCLISLSASCCSSSLPILHERCFDEVAWFYWKGNNYEGPPIPTWMSDS